MTTDKDKLDLLGGPTPTNDDLRKSITTLRAETKIEREKYPQVFDSWKTEGVNDRTPFQRMDPRERVEWKRKIQLIGEQYELIATIRMEMRRIFYEANQAGIPVRWISRWMGNALHHTTIHGLIEQYRIGVIEAMEFFSKKAPGFLNVEVEKLLEEKVLENKKRKARDKKQKRHKGKRRSGAESKRVKQKILKRDDDDWLDY